MEEDNTEKSDAEGRQNKKKYLSQVAIINRDILNKHAYFRTCGKSYSTEVLKLVNVRNKEVRVHHKRPIGERVHEIRDHVFDPCLGVGYLDIFAQRLHADWADWRAGSILSGLIFGSIYLLICGFFTYYLGNIYFSNYNTPLYSYLQPNAAFPTQAIPPFHFGFKYYDALAANNSTANGFLSSSASEQGFQYGNPLVFQYYYASDVNLANYYPNAPSQPSQIWQDFSPYCLICPTCPISCINPSQSTLSPITFSGAPNCDIVTLNETGVSPKSGSSGSIFSPIYMNVLAPFNWDYGQISTFNYQPKTASPNGRCRVPINSYAYPTGSQSCTINIGVMNAFCSTIGPATMVMNRSPTDVIGVCPAITGDYQCGVVGGGSSPISSLYADPTFQGYYFKSSPFYNNIYYSNQEASWIEVDIWANVTNYVNKSYAAGASKFPPFLQFSSQITNLLDSGEFFIETPHKNPAYSGDNLDPNTISYFKLNWMTTNYPRVYYQQTTYTDVESSSLQYWINYLKDPDSLVKKNMNLLEISNNYKKKPLRSGQQNLELLASIKFAIDANTKVHVREPNATIVMIFSITALWFMTYKIMAFFVSRINGFIYRQSTRAALHVEMDKVLNEKAEQKAEELFLIIKTLKEMKEVQAQAPHWQDLKDKNEVSKLLATIEKNLKDEETMVAEENKMPM